MSSISKPKRQTKKSSMKKQKKPGRKKKTSIHASIPYLNVSTESIKSSLIVRELAESFADHYTNIEYKLAFKRKPWMPKVECDTHKDIEGYTDNMIAYRRRYWCHGVTRITARLERNQGCFIEEWMVTVEDCRHTGDHKKTAVLATKIKGNLPVALKAADEFANILMEKK